MTLTLVAMVKRENMIDMKFGEAFDDPQPFILTVTPQYVAQQTSKVLPINGLDLQTEQTHDPRRHLSSRANKSPA